MRKTPGRGSAHRSPDTRRIVVQFDVEMFQQIRARAVLAQTSVAEQVRLLVEWGLEADL